VFLQLILILQYKNVLNLLIVYLIWLINSWDHRHLKIPLLDIGFYHLKNCNLIQLSMGYMNLPKYRVQLLHDSIWFQNTLMIFLVMNKIIYKLIFKKHILFLHFFNCNDFACFFIPTYSNFTKCTSSNYSYWFKVKDS